MGDKSIDNKDAKILRALDVNARISLTEIGRKTRMSKEVVSYRMKNLIENGVLKQFYAYVDMARLGFEPLLLYVKCRTMAENTEADIVNYMKSIDNTSAIIKLIGHWDFLIILWTKNMSDYRKIEDNFMKRFGSIIQRKTVAVTAKRIKFKHNFLYSSDDRDSITIGNRGNEKIDSIDLKILAEISKNCRTPLSDIAKKVKLTSVAVKNRLKVLEKKGIIAGYSVKINTSFYGFSQYRVFLSISDPIIKEKLLGYLSFNQNIASTTEEIGESDIICEIYVKNLKDMELLIRQIKTKFPGVIDQYIFPVYDYLFVRTLPNVVSDVVK